MDIQPMPGKILRVTNTMIRKSLLPNFAPADFHADRVRVAAFDQLHGAFERHMRGGREKQMNVIGHQDESMQREFSLAPVTI